MFRSMLLPSWARLLAVVLMLGLAVGFGDVAMADASESDEDSSAAASSSTSTAKEVLAILNAARAKAGCGPLKLNSKLMAAAKAHARAMAEKNFFGHKGKDGSKFSSRFKRQGYSYRMAAENIAAGQSSATQVAHDWLGSPGHRKNIMNCKLKDTGIAVAHQPDDGPIDGNSKPYYYYWVQDFGLTK